ncbi:MAG: hypothetical protein IPL27_00020 [Lewinellaceae bacterium]|nr:hypothetical protein [Lewinellaceae bacterium]
MRQLNKHDKASTTLLVYLHGDSNRGGLYDRHFKHFNGFAESTHRVCGHDSAWLCRFEQKRLHWQQHGRGDNYTTHNVDAAANAIQALKPNTAHAV